MPLHGFGMWDDIKGKALAGVKSQLGNKDSVLRSKILPGLADRFKDNKVLQGAQKLNNFAALHGRGAGGDDDMEGGAYAHTYVHVGPKSKVSNPRALASRVMAEGVADLRRKGYKEVYRHGSRVAKSGKFNTRHPNRASFTSFPSGVNIRGKLPQSTSALESMLTHATQHKGDTHMYDAEDGEFVGRARKQKNWSERTRARHAIQRHIAKYAPFKEIAKIAKVAMEAYDSGADPHEAAEAGLSYWGRTSTTG